MSARRPDGSIRGFLHDFDYASNWKRFLADIHGFDTNLDGWHAYTLDEYKKDMAKRKERFGVITGDSVAGPSIDVDADEDVDDDESEQQSSGGSLPVEQKEPQDVPRTPGGSTDAPHTPGGFQSKDEQRKEEQKRRTVPCLSFGLLATVLTGAISRERYISWRSRSSTSTSGSRTKLGTI